MRSLRVAAAALMLLCVASPAGAEPDTDVSGRWTGTWKGFGIFRISREQPAIVDLRQGGGPEGDGRLVLHDAGAAESVPLPLRLAGSNGVPVSFKLSGSRMTMTGSDGITVDLTLEGDELIGRIRGAVPEVALVLRRDEPTATPSPIGEVEVEPSPGPGTPVVAEAPLVPAEPAEPAALAPEPASDPEPAAETVRPRVTEFAEAQALQSVYFDFDQATIRTDAVAALEANAAWLKTHPDVLVLIEGHCDERGTSEYNVALGERRARAARDFLVSLGIAADRLTTITYGEERPECGEQTEACWATNRRAVFRTKANE